MPKLTWLLFFLWLPMAQAGLLDSLKSTSEPEFLRVEQAFPLSVETDGSRLTAHWASKPGYYLYKHRIFIQQDGTRIEPAAFSIPGIEKEDEAFGLVTAFYGDLDADFDLSQLTQGKATLHHQGCADAGLCYPPQSLSIDVPDTVLSVSPVPSQKTSTAQKPASSSTALEPITSKPANGSTDDSWFSGRSWFAVIGLFFILGLGLTFTPCVLPMVPILTSVVLGQGIRSRKQGFLLSTTYVLGMAITYAAAGLTVGLLGAGANVQAWMQTPWVLSLFAGLFVLLSLSMFGLFELQLPSNLRNRLNDLNQKQSGGQWISVFVMGVLSALVVSPCVSAPLAGALVYLSTTGDALLGGSALLALGLGMGAPLIILGTTGASALPKAGSWMNQIKIFFGVLLLAVAIWLISRLLPGSVSLALWGALALVYAIVSGALEPAITPAQRLAKGISWLLLVYGTSAFVGALQGHHDPLNPLRSLTGATTAQHTERSPFYQTDRISDINAQITTSDAVVMIDLYADWCISCKVMDEEIFAQPDVQNLLKSAAWLQLDITDQTKEHVEFLQSNGVFGPPTILFYRDGKEITDTRIVGEISKQGFLAHIKRHTLNSL